MWMHLVDGDVVWETLDRCRNIAGLPHARYENHVGVVPGMYIFRPPPSSGFRTNLGNREEFWSHLGRFPIL